MDVEITISYSDNRRCTVTLAKPATGQPIYRVATSSTGVLQSVSEGLREARRLFDTEPWEDRSPARTN